MFFYSTNNYWFQNICQKNYVVLRKDCIANFDEMFGLIEIANQKFWVPIAFQTPSRIFQKHWWWWGLARIQVKLNSKLGPSITIVMLHFMRKVIFIMFLKMMLIVMVYLRTMVMVSVIMMIWTNILTNQK